MDRKRNKRVRGRVYRRRGPGSLCGRGRSRSEDGRGAGSAALAAIGEGETTQGLAVPVMGGRKAADWTKRGHGGLLRVEFWDLLTEKSRQGCRSYELKQKSPGETGA